MGRANRPIALLLLLMAVVCSPAGVCLFGGVVSTVQGRTPAHPHNCGQSGDGTSLAAGEEACCTEPQTGFVSVFRFTLHKQAPPPIVDMARGWMPKTSVRDQVRFDCRAPLVLRI